MRKTIFVLLLSLIMTFFFLPSQAFAADVYYFGNSGTDSDQTNKNYALTQRLKDLLDFTSGRPLSERSGKLSGSVTTQAEYNKVSGNRSKSFLENGWDYSTDVNLNLQEKLWKNYNLEGQVMMRKTDNPRIEARRDVRVKEYSLKVSNPKNLFLMGDFYGELSPFTLSSSLEGITAEIKPDDAFAMKYILARQNDADEAAGLYQRNVLGAKLDAFLFRDAEKISNARIGLQAVTNQDDSATLDPDSSLKDLRNTVVSVDGDLSFVRYFSVNYEFARSFYMEDEDSATLKDQSSANSIHVAPQVQFGNTVLRHVYNYAQPDFFTANGSAAPDKIQHQTTLNHRFSSRASVSLMRNYYWDHLTGSSRTKRTVNDEKSLSFNFVPLASRESLRARAYTSWNLKNSDDTGNTAESRTATFGFALNDRWKNADVGFSYEHRAFTNYADNSLNDYFDRVGITLSREYSVLQRRLYLSLSPNIDIRRTKSDDNKDVNLNVSLSGQYDVSKEVLARFGHNIIDSNSAKADAGYLNTRSFLEIDWALGKDRNAHIVFRGNLNRYLHEDGMLGYDETQGVLKCVFQF